MDKLGKLLQLN